MVARVVRLGTARVKGEGTRIGTVRRPPRGVPKTAFAEQDWYDVWFPNLAPSVETVKLGQQATSDVDWNAFRRKYRAEMATPDNSRTLDVLAALSSTAQAWSRAPVERSALGAERSSGEQTNRQTNRCQSPISR